MVISQTPLRMSFAGGGSDLPSFYSKHSGAVIGTSIDKYIYITVNKKFDKRIRASYSITEFANRPEELKHELIRESLKLLYLDGGLEITSISDIPSKGTGLGSSSSYTVGLLNALNAHQGIYSSAKYLSETACSIEIGKCGKPIGKQDQYLSAYGGFNFIEFYPDGSVEVSPVICKAATINKLEENLLMFYTKIGRSADTILSKQDHNIQTQTSTVNTLKKMVLLAREMRDVLCNNNLKKFGEILDANWELKKRVSGGISTPKIDEWYQSAKKAGAIGGKILGAGGGGFLLLYASPKHHQKIIKTLNDIRPIKFSFENEGSKIIYYRPPK